MSSIASRDRSPAGADRVLELERAGLLEVQAVPAFDRLARHATRLLKAPMSSVTVVSGPCAYAAGLAGIGEPWTSRRRLPPCPMVSHDVVARGVPISVPDLRPTTYGEGLRTRLGLSSVLSVPIHTPTGQVMGALNVGDPEVRHWTQEEREALEDLAKDASHEVERRIAATTLERHDRFTAAQQRVLELVAGDAPLADCLDAVAHAIDSAGGGEVACSILLASGDGTRLLDGAGPSLPPEYREAANGVRVGPQSGSCGTAAHRGEPVVVADIATDPLWRDARDVALSHGLRACWSTPVLDEDRRVLATFAVYYAEPREPDEQHRALVDDAVHLIRIALRRHREREELVAAARESAAMATEHAALHRVAVEVAREDGNRVAAVIAEESGRLLDADVVQVCEGHDPPVDARHRVSVPIQAAGAGASCALVAARDSEPFASREIEQLRSFADLAGIAWVGEAHRRRLSQHARADPLTGLSNHRVFQECLREKIDEARLRQAPLSLVLLNLDNFREVNDVHGHRAGDAVLVEVADRATAILRSGDALARVGGDSFALLLGDTDEEEAEAMAGLTRAAIGRDTGPPGTTVTITAGVATLEDDEEGPSLVSRADDALRRAKHTGGDRVVRWSPGGSSLTSEQRAAEAARLRALAGVRALARAVDAKDASTHRHSERVAELSSRLARELGWPAHRVELLHAAALVHDVGKIGVPDRILLKRRPLTTADWGRLYQHPTLGAQIAAELLTAEQVAWIHQHHERIDGEGYPDGLPGAHISDGGRLLALADAWDAMTSVRAYREPLDAVQALAECRRCVGSQFSAEAVAALERLAERGELPGPGS